ncbi:hypothetical protein CONPUDRAFT_72267 [Coniophora puteana RWD-64-598 SS2]|uniref:Uncharacterized protein n=1 Tax=Coniophora puteana (strain RWD-64-598) TaxID=741705 RepID=A0A5M3MS22_CONPW|nr:uncharacterized protein CONPUDRAFT_72267 [Coniophora puteana RWD-64-598 SS2]EIW81900.1 hypothetical protein CONPUDRAFT_72267 [Coniophora puteana RWD-64-598 SS2]
MPKAPQNPKAPPAPRTKSKKFSRNVESYVRCAHVNAKLDMDDTEGEWGIWTLEQREFMVSQLPTYGEYSEKKNFALFWPDFQSTWYFRWPELKALFPNLSKDAELTQFQRDVVERGIQFRNVKTNAAMRWAFRNSITCTRSISGRSATMLDRMMGSNSRCNKDWEWFCKLYYDKEVGPEVTLILNAIKGTPTGGQVLDAVRSVAQRKLRDGPQSVRDEIEGKKDQQKVVLAGPSPASDPKLNALAARANTMTVMPSLAEIHEYVSSQTVGGKSTDGFRFATMIVGRDPLSGQMCSGCIHVGLDQAGLDFGQVSQSWKRCTEEFAAFAKAPGRPVEIVLRGKGGQNIVEKRDDSDKEATTAQLLSLNEDKAGDVVMQPIDSCALEATTTSTGQDATTTEELGLQDATCDILAHGNDSNAHTLVAPYGEDSTNAGIAIIDQTDGHGLSPGNMSDGGVDSYTAPAYFDPAFFDTTNDYSWLDDPQVQQALSHFGSMENQFPQYDHAELSEALFQGSGQLDMNIPIDFSAAQPSQLLPSSQPNVSPDLNFPGILQPSTPQSSFLPQDPGPPLVLSLSHTPVFTGVARLAPSPQTTPDVYAAQALSPPWADDQLPSPSHVLLHTPWPSQVRVPSSSHSPSPQPSTGHASAPSLELPRSTPPRPLMQVGNVDGARRASNRAHIKFNPKAADNAIGGLCLRAPGKENIQP